MRLTPHFSLEEFKCRNGEPYPIDRLDDDGKRWGETRLYRLCLLLEAIRAEIAQPIRVLSAWRPLSYNRGIKSHDTSQHPRGRAADIVAMGGLGAYQLHAAILQMYRQGRLRLLGGLGDYGDRFVHVDVRPRPEDDHLARWTGGRVNADG